MKYGIIDNGRVTEPVNIPSPLPSWAADALGFMAKAVPGKTGWVVVPDDAVPGTIDNGDGTFTNPATTQDARPRSWDAYEFLTQRLTASERKAIRSAAKIDADVEDFQHLLDVAAASKKRIEADNPELIAGLNLMESAGLIAEGRAAEIVG